MGRALVVGGGAAGLAAALFLRRLGHEVRVFEKMPRTAPLIRGFERGGLRFDTGFHYAGGLEKGVLRRYLDVLGVCKNLDVVPLAAEGGELLRFDGGDDFPVVRGRDAFAASVAAACPGMENGIARFLAKIAEYLRYSPYLNPDLGTFDSHRLYAEQATLDGFFDDMRASPRLRMLLGFRCLLYGAHPALARPRDFALVNGDYLDDAATVSGGGKALAEAFDQALAEAGAAVETGVEVAGILLDADRKVRGVRIRRGGERGSEEIPGDMCVYCGAPAALPGLLPAGALRPVLANRLLNLRETNKPFIIFAAARSGFFRHRQIFCCPDESFDHWFPGRGAPARTHGTIPVYVSGGDGRDGRFPVTALTLVPDAATAQWREGGQAADADGYREFKRRTAEAVRRRLLGACPEFGGELEIVDAASDVSLRHWSFNSSGSLYGTLHGTATPPILPVTRVGGLALAGQNIILPGLLGVMVSAAVAAGSLAGHDDVLGLLR